MPLSPQQILRAVDLASIIVALGDAVLHCAWVTSRLPSGNGTRKLQIESIVCASQVVISFTLFFVCLPLVQFTNSAARMGRFRNGFVARWFGIIVTVIIGGLNGYLIISSIKVCCSDPCCVPFALL